MSVAKKCDRCGKHYEPYDGKIDGCPCNAVKTAQVDRHDTFSMDRKKYDLCGDCLDSFAAWLQMDGDWDKKVES